MLCKLVEVVQGSGNCMRGLSRPALIAQSVAINLLLVPRNVSLSMNPPTPHTKPPWQRWRQHKPAGRFLRRPPGIDPGLGRGPRICISNPFPGDADVAGPGPHF